MPESFARVVALVDEIVLVDDDDLLQAMDLIVDTLGVLVEPAGAAGIAALLRYGDAIPGERAAAIFTGSGGSHPSWRRLLAETLDARGSGPRRRHSPPDLTAHAATQRCVRATGPTLHL